VMTRQLKRPEWLDDDGELHIGVASSEGFASIWVAMKDLLTTESARRRAQIEVVRGDEEDDADGPTPIDQYRKRVGG